MKERCSPRLHLWTPGTVFLGVCGAAPGSFGFWGTTASRQHTTILRMSLLQRNTVEDYWHPSCCVPSGGQESLGPLPQLANIWWKGGETKQEIYEVVENFYGITTWVNSSWSLNTFSLVENSARNLKVTHPKSPWLGPCFPLCWEAARNIKGIISIKEGEINGMNRTHLRQRKKL